MAVSITGKPGRKPAIRCAVRPTGSAGNAGKARPFATGAARADNSELAQLLLHTQARCSRSFARLYLLTRPPLLRIVLRINSHQAEAEEILQEVFVSAWQRSQQYDGQRGSVMAWLGTMAHHKAVSSLRYRSRRPQAHDAGGSADIPIDPYAMIPCGASQPMDILAQGRAAQAVHAVLDALPDAQRACLVLAFFDGLTHSEIAQQLGKPLGTVKSQLRRAMLLMRPDLAGH